MMKLLGSTGTSSIQLVARLCGVSLSHEESPSSSLTLISDTGESLAGLRAITNHILLQATPEIKDTLKINEEQTKELEKWISQCEELQQQLHSNTKQSNASLHKLNSSLLPRVFLVSNHLTLADVLFFGTVHPLVQEWKSSRSNFGNITRWFDHVQHLPQLKEACKGFLSSVPINVNVSEDKGNENSANESSSVAPEKNENQPKAQGKKAVAATPAVVSAEAKQQEGQSSSSQSNKEKQPKNDQGQKKDAQPKKEDKTAPPAAAKNDGLSHTEDVSRFDIRVGKIITCKKHEGADSLYVEQIDVGEPEPRQVVSGLVKFIPLDQMINHRVILLCNLKPSNLKGVKSHAMVLAASNADHTQVELVQPPEGAAIGDKVSCDGYPGVPEKTLKKETLEAVLPLLKTNDQLVATFKGTPLTTSAGPCFCRTISNGPIK